MAKAYICDRCGKIVTENPITMLPRDAISPIRFRVSQVYESRPPKEFDLCDACNTELFTWLFQMEGEK